MQPPIRQCDIFCKVVDNFGDIGVCWRLARQLADEHAFTVRLWVDDLALAQRFAGLGHDRVQLQHWSEQLAFAQAAELVIETFSCGIPPCYQTAMFTAQSIWLNVEYLSAEHWVEDFHGRPSPQANGLVRWFFYPGFTPATGGLLREACLPALHADVAAQAATFWQRLGCAPALNGQMTVSLFCYAHAPLAALLQAFASSPQAVRLLVPESIAPMVAKALNKQTLEAQALAESSEVESSGMHQALDLTTLNPGQPYQHGACEICVIPFLSQTDYDCLLHLCDVNFVRGEDSWVRAIWAGKPMVWLPYQQTDHTHLQKLEAFLHCYLADAQPAVAATVREMMQAWASGEIEQVHWSALLRHYSELGAHSQRVASALMKSPDLVTNMVIFIEKLQKNRV